MRDFLHTEWFTQLDEYQQTLVELSVALYERERLSSVVLHDYSFVIFPIAKAYEGFLKDYLFALGLITEETFQSKKFRLGKALNPDVRPTQQDEFWVFDDLSQLCGGVVSRELWDTWLTCRNQVFHYFPLSIRRISLQYAGECVLRIAAAIESAHQCKIADIRKNVRTVKNVRSVASLQRETRTQSRS